MDIDLETKDGRRVIGEIKTTTPYNGPDFGAQQRKSFERDFAKLSEARADHRYMFVTENATFKILCRPAFIKKLAGVTIVQLTSGDEIDA